MPLYPKAYMLKRTCLIILALVYVVKEHSLFPLSVLLIYYHHIICHLMYLPLPSLPYLILSPFISLHLVFFILHAGASSGSTTTALAGGCVAGVLVAFGAGLAYVYKAKGGKMEKNKYPAVHMQAEEEACEAIEDGDLIPDCALKRSQSCMSVPDGYDMIPASKIEEQHSVV